MFFSTKDIEELKKVIVGSGPGQINPFYDLNNNIVQEDLLTIAWNYGKREPRFFSKETYNKLLDSNWTISETMLASAANLLYFYPFVKKFEGQDNYYISGDNIAKSTALYAYEVATKLNG